jgi:hypothetical protein
MARKDEELNLSHDEQEEIYSLMEHENIDIDEEEEGEPLQGSGYIVVTRTGLQGKTRHNEHLVGGKMRVYTDCGKKLLCSPATLTLQGFWD